MPHQSESNWRFTVIYKLLASFRSNFQNSQPRDAFKSANMPSTTHPSATTSASSGPTFHQRALRDVGNTSNVLRLLDPPTRDLSVFVARNRGSLRPNPRPLRRSYAQAGMSHLSSSVSLTTQTHNVQKRRSF